MAGVFCVAMTRQRSCFAPDLLKQTNSLTVGCSSSLLLPQQLRCPILEFKEMHPSRLGFLSPLTPWIPLTLSLIAVAFLHRTQPRREYNPNRPQGWTQNELRRIEALGRLHHDLSDLAHLKVHCLIELVDQAEERKQWVECMEGAAR